MANSRFPLIVNSSAGQIQELNSSDALVVNSGVGLGISFTPNPGGGTGDFATITYEHETGTEKTNFKIAVQNDGSSSNKDNIEISTPNGASINDSIKRDSSLSPLWFSLTHIGDVQV